MHPVNVWFLGEGFPSSADAETSGNPSRGLWTPLTIMVQFEIILFDSKTLVITGFEHDFMLVYELYWSAYVCLYPELYYICTRYERKTKKTSNMKHEPETTWSIDLCKEAINKRKEWLKKKKFNDLLSEYNCLADSLLKHNKNLYDGMYYDIQGYIAEGYNEIELEHLNNQVKACRKLLKGYEELHYIFC